MTSTISEQAITTIITGDEGISTHIIGSNAIATVISSVGSEGPKGSSDTSILWKDENFDMTNARSTAGAAPDLVVYPGTFIELATFDGVNTAEGVSLTKEINHDYLEGTDIYFHVHWYPTTTASGNVQWNVDYFATNPGLPTVTISGYLSVSVATPLIAWRQVLSEFPAVSLGAISLIGTQISFRFYRNPSLPGDNYRDDAALATMGWHYQTDSRGSVGRTTK
jgi:hypothetical protein